MTYNVQLTGWRTVYDCLSVSWCLNSDKGGIEMMNVQQPKALRLADYIEGSKTLPSYQIKAAAELRRLHSVNVELLEALTVASERLEVRGHKFGAEQARAAIARAAGLNKAQE
jgi:hypothetical protein